MMVKPWAKAIAAIPGSPTPSPTIAAAPAPMNTKAKVPMNSARSLGAIRLDIVDSRDGLARAARSGLRQGAMRWLEVAGGTGGAATGRRNERASLRGDRLRLEIDAQRLRDAGAVFGIGLRAVRDVSLLDVHGGPANRASRVVEQRLALGRIHLPEQVAGLLIMVVVDAVIPMRGCAFDL